MFFQPQAVCLVSGPLIKHRKLRSTQQSAGGLGTDSPFPPSYPWLRCWYDHSHSPYISYGTVSCSSSAGMGGGVVFLWHMCKSSISMVFHDHFSGWLESGFWGQESYQDISWWYPSNSWRRSSHTQQLEAYCKLQGPLHKCRRTLAKVSLIVTETKNASVTNMTCITGFQYAALNHFPTQHIPNWPDKFDCKTFFYAVSAVKTTVLWPKCFGDNTNIFLIVSPFCGYRLNQTKTSWIIIFCCKVWMKQKKHHHVVGQSLRHQTLSLPFSRSLRAPRSSVSW